MKSAIVTKDSLLNLLLSATAIKQMHIVGRALAVVYANQEPDEQRAETVRHNNGIGFTVGDASIGCSHAQSYILHSKLDDWAVSVWVKPDSTGYPRICKYHRQLNEAATRKALEML